MTLVEKVARGIAHLYAGSEEDYVDVHWHHWKPEALAALRAMREPTDHMIAQGVSAAEHYASSDEIYSRMIDAALSEAERHVNEEGI